MVNTFLSPGMYRPTQVYRESDFALVSRRPPSERASPLPPSVLPKLWVLTWAVLLLLVFVSLVKVPPLELKVALPEEDIVKSFPWMRY